MAAGLLQARLRPGQPVVVQAPATVDSTIVLEALWLMGPVVVPVVAVTGDDLREVVHGDAKGVRHSHEALLASYEAPLDELGAASLMTFPAGHIASGLGLVRPLTAGGTTVIMDRWSRGRAGQPPGSLGGGGVLRARPRLG